jgi:hypothetical protein
MSMILIIFGFQGAFAPMDQIIPPQPIFQTTLNHFVITNSQQNQDFQPLRQPLIKP